jgi:predicted transcriptional regulator YdeE
MKKDLVQHPSMVLVGLVIRTNNKDEFNPEVRKIGNLVAQYFQSNIAAQIPNRKNPGVTIAAYTDYESDEHGDYTYFIGEEVKNTDTLPNNLVQITVPAGKYQKFTTEVETMPSVVINAWQEIWKMGKSQPDGERAYLTDFEVYDHRAQDPNAAVVDIYLGLK